MDMQHGWIPVKVEQRQELHHIVILTALHGTSATADIKVSLYRHACTKCHIVYNACTKLDTAQVNQLVLTHSLSASLPIWQCHVLRTCDAFRSLGKVDTD